MAQDPIKLSTGEDTTMHTPIMLIGWGQATQPKHATAPWQDPIDLMEQAARDAASTAGVGVLAQVDTLLVVRSQSRDLPDAGHALARRLGITPRTVKVSGIGGHVPQYFVNQAAGMLARGEAETVLICGAETYYPRSAEAVRGDAGLLQGIPADYAADDAAGSSELEQAHGLTLPIHGFPLFENALWAESGLSRGDWLSRVGQMWSGFSEVAAAHPNGWTRAPVDAVTITTPSADNRPICFPYTKRMVSLVMADLGAAVILTTATRAAALRDGAGSPVYFLGGAYARDRQRFFIQKSAYTRSPAMAQAVRSAEARAGVSAAELECFDLYSCFPCAVTVAKREIGIGEHDPRPLTLTGGLGFFGGPGSNYALHGIATLAEAIAAGRYRSGMSTALGWFMHKYAAGIYSATPREVDLRDADLADTADPDAGADPVPMVAAPEGSGFLDTYTVIYGRDHQPVCSLLYGHTPGGLRFVANGAPEPAMYAALLDENQVGRALRVKQIGGRNVAVFTD